MDTVQRAPLSVAVGMADIIDRMDVSSEKPTMAIITVAQNHRLAEPQHEKAEYKRRNDQQDDIRCDARFYYSYSMQ